LRAAHLLWEASPPLSLAVVVFVVAEAVLPNLALVAIGNAVGHIPAALAHGLGSASGGALVVALALGAGAYAASLLRRPAQDLLSAHCSAAMSGSMRRRLAVAVCAPPGVEHLEDPATLDQLSSASGELAGNSQPSEAPMTLAGLVGDRLAGLISCAVLSSLRWWLGLMFLVGWSAIRPPLRRALAERATLARSATPNLRQSWYYLGCAWRPAFAKEVRIFGLGAWVLGRHRERWLAGMGRPWQQLRRLQRKTALFALVVAAMYAVGAGALALAAYHHQVGLQALATMLPMMPLTMQAGGVSATDVSLEQMLAALPDLDGLVDRLTKPAAQTTGPEAQPRRAAWAPTRGLCFESVSYSYPGSDHPVLNRLDLELAAGRSLGLVGVNGAGKTTLVTLLARLREPSAGCVTLDGTDLLALDARSWQRQVAVVYQDFTRYPLSARENIALRDLDGPIDEAALVEAARRAGALTVVESLPDGWDTICAPGYRGGADLSGGQWQRIALARALYSVARGAGVLVLDEPTAQLDVRAEAAFYDSFFELTAGVTTLVISHRFSTVRRAERIAVLDKGTITELGSHAELLAAGGTYSEMFRLQAERFQKAARNQADAKEVSG
jgi:ATP-binding cassette, subfamily B, bacterial